MSTKRPPMENRIARSFVFSGKAVITLTNTSNNHVMMYKITKINDFLWFVHYNFGDVGVRWRYVSCVHKDTPWRLCSADKSKYSPSDKVWVVFEWLLRRIHGYDNTYPEVIVNHNGFCGRCGRLLTDDKSVEHGLGPVCRIKIWEKERKEVTK